MQLRPLHSKPQSRKKANPEFDILYVEDSDTNWRIAEYALRAKYTLTRAANAQQTFSLLAERKFDLILMDIELKCSDLNGIQIVKTLRGKYDPSAPDYTRCVVTPVATPIVFVTAYTARYSPEELKKMGGDDCVTKPVNLTALSLIITRLLVRSMGS